MFGRFQPEKLKFSHPGRRGDGWLQFCQTITAKVCACPCCGAVPVPTVQPSEPFPPEPSPDRITGQPVLSLSPLNGPRGTLTGEPELFFQHQTSSLSASFPRKPDLIALKRELVSHLLPRTLESTQQNTLDLYFPALFRAHHSNPLLPITRPLSPQRSRAD